MLNQLKINQMKTIQAEKVKREKVYLTQMEKFREEMMNFIRDRKANKSSRQELIDRGLKILNKNLK